MALFAAELSEHHLIYVYQDTYDVRPKWYNVGLCLLLEPSTLDAIGKDFHTCEDRYRVCLQEWLKRDSRVKSMKKLIAALRNKIVREDNLANQLEERHTGQKGPSQGNSVAIYTAKMACFNQQI